MPSMNPQNGSFYPTFNPTHKIPTTEQEWEDLKQVLEEVDVLVVPGGMGVRNPDLKREGGEVEFVRRMMMGDQFGIGEGKKGEFGVGGEDMEGKKGVIEGEKEKKEKKKKYLITVCTGAAVAAMAGVLDGRRATTNKRAWGEVVPLGKEGEVKWYVLSLPSAS